MNVFLKPGEVYVSEKPTRVSTILGSCVAVTVFNERLKIGGICHARLPRRREFSNAGGEFNYVDCSIYYILDRFEGLGVTKGETTVKMFGGADVLERTNQNTASVGRENIETALEIIRDEELYLAASDVGGDQGRKVFFFTHTGEVLLKRLGNVSRGGYYEQGESSYRR